MLFHIGSFLGRRHWGGVLSAVSIVMLAIVGVSVAVLLKTQRSEYRPQGKVDLRTVRSGSVADESTPDRDDQVVRVAIAPVIAPEKSLEMYRVLVSYLGHKLDRKVVCLTGKDYSEVNNMVRHGQCDVAMVCTYSFVLGERDYGMRLLAIPEVRGKRVYTSLIIARKGEGYSSLLDFRGKTFAFSDMLSTSGWLYPMSWLTAQSMDVDLFFKKQIISGSHDRSVYAVKAGVVDGAAVDSIVFEEMLDKDPSLKKNLVVVQESEPFGMPPLVVPRSLSAKMVAELQSVLFDMHEDEEGKKVLASLSIDRFAPVKEEAYDSVRHLVSGWERVSQ